MITLLSKFVSCIAISTMTVTVILTFESFKAQGQGYDRSIYEIKIRKVTVENKGIYNGKFCLLNDTIKREVCTDTLHADEEKDLFIPWQKGDTLILKADPHPGTIPDFEMEDGHSYCWSDGFTWDAGSGCRNRY